MIKVESVDVWGFEHAVRGMRNPMNSWNKSDSFYCGQAKCRNCYFYEPDEFGGTPICHDNNDKVPFVIGKNDLNLMQRLCKAGSTHRKFMRQIFISLDITAPLYWWKEFDTYKVGTVANSCSTMHKIQAKEFTLDDFSHDQLTHISIQFLEALLIYLNNLRSEYLATKDKSYWWQMIQLLPSSYNQKRTITMNYENALNICETRENHKLDEWRELVQILKTELPYFKQILEGDLNG